MHPTQSQHHHHGPPQQATIPENSSPPIPERNNTRNRLELDSVSPAVQRPNPMDTPVSPITPGSPSNRDRANFSYPSRAPPQGVPRQIPTQQIPPQLQPGHQQPTPQQWGEAWNTQQHNGYDESSRPVPFRAGHSPSQPQQHQPQKQPTIANLKAAAHGIHVSSDSTSQWSHAVLILFTGRWRSSTWQLQQQHRSPLRPARRRHTRKEPSHHRCRPIRNRVTELCTPSSSTSCRRRTASATNLRSKCTKATVHGPSRVRLSIGKRREGRR